MHSLSLSLLLANVGHCTVSSLGVGFRSVVWKSVNVIVVEKLEGRNQCFHSLPRVKCGWSVTVWGELETQAGICL